MEWSELDKQLKSDEDPYIERKESSFITSEGKEANTEIAAQLTSFANRSGGRICVGVKNDGFLEGAKIDSDKARLRILSIAHNLCSPVPEVSFEYMTFAKGDVLLINVPKRTDIPHAVIHREGSGEILTRKYYIRSGPGKRLVNDDILRAMFKETGDPFFVSFNSTLCMWYEGNTLDFSTSKSLAYFRYIEPFVENLPSEDVEYLQSNGGEHVLDFWLSILPYAFLIDLSSKLSNSWLVDIERRLDGSILYYTRELDIPSETISFANLPSSNSSLLSKMSIDINYILERNVYDFKLPKDTQIRIGTKGEGPIYEFSIEFNNPAFTMRIIFVPQSLSGRAPFSIRDIVPHSNQENLSYLVNMLKVEVSFAFPERDILFYKKHRDFVHLIQDIVREYWKWDKELYRLQEIRMKQMNYNIAKIVSMLENHKVGTQ
jgi:hypothetical protein